MNTPTLQDAAASTWDALVVGAGPAGTLAALELARAGLQVLIVERARFPRDKPCGGCLNATSVARLREAGLGTLLAERGAVPLERVWLHAGGRPAQLPLLGGYALSRASLDDALLAAARSAGVAALTGVRASRDESDASPDACALQLSPEDGGPAVRVATRVLLVAGGLGGALLGETRAQPAGHSRLGAGAVLQGAGTLLPQGELHMACGPHGYVGLVAAEHGRLVVAAALDPSAVVAAGGLGAAVAAIVVHSGLAPIVGLADARWLGTPPLTRRTTTLAARRVFVLGDAAGFVEPFTGEGIAWALTAARAVRPFALAAARRWDDVLSAEWPAAWFSVVARRQRLCRELSWLLRRPLLVRAAVRMLSVRPQLGAPLMARLGAVAP